MKILLKFKIVGLVVLSLIIGWFLHYYYYAHIVDRSREIIQIRENSDAYRFINPIILTVDNRDVEFDEYRDLKSKVQTYINIHSVNGVKKASFYFRDLNTGEWVGVNEDELYSPSSMLKVATLIAYSRLADDDPKILLEKVLYEPSDISGQNYRPKQLAKGYHAVRELLQQMIVESDNDAMHSLNALHTDEILEIYKDLELPDIFSDEQDFMSPRSYSRLFRSLYNGSYISHFYSDEALELLTYSKFNQGIKSGVGDTVVAHKFGEYTNTLLGTITEKELHDCGIVYYPSKPYFICVMTKGQDFSSLEKIIADISKITFDYIKSKK